MPLCPQITNTPITVTQTGDFTVSSVVPAVADTKDGLAQDFSDIVVDLDGKTKAYYQTTAPTGPGLNEGDIWFDTDDGNKQYYYTGSAWVSVQDTAIAAAQAAATAAQTTADGKNRIYRQTTQPSTGPFAEGDLWFDTDDDNKIYRYTSGSWSTAVELGSNAISSLSANKLTAGTIDASVITVSNINAGNISTGTLNADRIASASITGTKIAAGTITASNIATNTITATQIAAGTITATQIASNTITASQIASNTITASQIAAGTITATQISSGYVYAGTINANQINAGTLTGFTIQTSSGTTAVILDGSTTSMYFKYLGTVYGHILPASSGSVMIHYGSTATPGGTAYPQFYVGGSAVYMAQSSTRYATVDSSGLSVSGDLGLTGGAFYTGTYETTSTAQTAGTYISQSGAIIARRDNAIPIFSHRWNATGTAELIRLVYNGADAGGINTSSAGSPSFRTTSDYRLKQDIQDFTGSADIIKATRLRSFKMNREPDKTVIGFVAHEFAEAAPDLVMGEKDAVDADGNPEYQSIMTTNLIPYLTGALKDIILRVEALEQGK